MTLKIILGSADHVRAESRVNIMGMRAGAVLVIAVVFTAVVAAREPVGVGSSDVFVTATVESPGVSGSEDQASGGSDVAASPASFPLPKQHFAGSVMYKRTVGMERFDTDHDVDGADGVDREIFGSHYVMGNAFKVRIPRSYAEKPEGVFEFSFNHIVFEVGRSRFTADCVNPRTYLYSGTISWRWICSLDFGSKTGAWNSAAKTASEVKIIALWSDKGCSRMIGPFVSMPSKNPLLVADCRALLAIKYFWLDEVAENRGELSEHHALFSWGVGDIEDWGGVLVAKFPNSNEDLANNCSMGKSRCSDRVVSVDLSASEGVDIDGKIMGEVPGELGDLSALTSLSLENNLLHGGIPASLGNASKPFCNKSVDAPYLDFPFDPPGVDWPNRHFPRYDIDLRSSDCRDMLRERSGLDGVVLDEGVFNRSLDNVVLGSGSSGARDVAEGVSDDYSIYAADVFFQQRMPEVSLEVAVEDGLAVYYIKFVADAIVDTHSASRLASRLSEKGAEFSRVGSRIHKIFRFSARAASGLSRFLGPLAIPINAILFLNDITKLLDGLRNVEHPVHLDPERSQLVYLDLSGNDLSGSIPASFENMDKLVFLYLNDNDLSGTIPDGIGMGGRSNGIDDSLRYINLSGNKLSGAIPSDLSFVLEYIDFSHNNLEGNVNWKTFTPMTGLIGLFLNNNALEGLGEIADDKSAPSMWYLDISNNMLVGKVTKYIGSIAGLQELDLSDNMLKNIEPLYVPNKPGVPPSFRFRFLDFSNNELTDISKIFLNVTSVISLRYLNLRGNKINELPKAERSGVRILEYADALQFLYLGTNNLDGSIEDHVPIDKLRNLIHLDVSKNDLSGSIPSSLRSVNTLIGLDLSNNKFSGMVPEWLAYFRDILVLDLSYNCFVGGMPNVLQDSEKFLLLRYEVNFFDDRDTNKCGELSMCANGRFVDKPLSNSGLVQDCEFLMEISERLKTNPYVSSIVSSWGIGNEQNRKIGKWTGVTVSDGRVTELDISLEPPISESEKSANQALLIPVEVFKLKKLTTLKLSNIGIAGSISEEVLALDDLEVLDLSHNWLSGEIPDSLGDIAYLTDLDLSHNMLSGEIPVGGALKFESIVRLDLSHNKLSGNLPQPLPANTPHWIPSFGDSAGLSNLRMVRYLDLSHNFFTGPLIESVDRVGFLKLEGSVLKLNDNCLTGTISWAIKELLGPEEDISNNDLDYWIIPTSTELLDQPEIDISNNNLDYTGWRGAGGTARKECFAGGCSGGVLVDETEKNPRLVADCEVLLELLEVWSGDVLDDWGEGEISGWTGVDVSGGRVTELSLENQRVSGALPAVIGDLGGLKVLDLSGNRLWGALPREVGNLSVLEVLDLSGNSLSGALPGEVGGLSVLTNLDLSSNNLSGGLPAGLGRLGKLERLDLSGNGFSGRIPSGLGRLSSLIYLDLSDNRLSGAIRAVSGRIPAGLGRLASLEVLDLSGNRLSGAIPAGLGGLSNLERLVLSDNSLSGGIPSELGNLRALEAGGLDLRRNCLLRPVPGLVSDLGEGIARLGWNLFLTPDDNPWCVPCSDGTFLPRSLTRNLIRDCFWLVKARRALHGGSGVPELSVVAGWGTAQNPDMHRWGGVGIQRGRVRSLDLSVALPPGFIASSGAASSLYRRQKLTGGIPSELASLWALESLDLSNNRFEGAIPIEFGSLSRLASLDLSRNRLSGGVPEDLGDLLELVSLDLSHNRLEGPVPEALGQPASGNKELARLFLNDNFLTGSIPDVLGNLPLVSLHLHYNCIVGATPANLFDGATPANLKVEDFKRKPNRGNCADRCSNGIYVASAGENKSLVNDCRALMAARKVWADLGSFTSQAHISNWGAGESRKIGDWGGVKVAASGGEMRVTKLELAGNGLSGGIPEELADLDALVSLDLSHNAISDPNNGLDKLAVSVDLVELDLSANGIKEQVPTSIGGLSKLRRLVLSDNELSGIIPSGPTPVPGATPLLDRLPALEHLDLSGNALKGLVPSSLSALKHLDLSDNEITGRLPGGLFEAEELSHLDLSDNQLAGTLPEKLYEHSGLVYLDLSHNRFSGAVKSGFKSLSLARLDLSGNGFSGSLPGFRLAPLAPIKVPNMPQEFSDESEQPDLYIVLSGDKTQGYFSSLVYLDLSRNRFSGPIPLGYGDFADERPMERLDLSRNQLTGSLPKWIDLLQFSDSDDYERSPDSLTNPEPDTFLVSLEHNLMCTPQDYALGDLRRNNGKTAPVDIRLGNNECPEDDHASIYVPGPVLNSTYELPSASPKDLQVAWQHPAGQTGLRYIVEPLLKDTAPEGQPEGEDCQVATSNTTATITSSESCEGFDAQHYTAKITPVFAPAGSENRYYGDTARAEEKKVYLKGWQFRTVQQSTTMQAIHDSLGLENDQEIFWMDGVNQVWLSYSKTSSSKRNRTLPAGTTIAIQKFPANADLNAAKLGSADSDTSVLLHNGWNVIPAGGRTTRPAGNNGAWFIDSSFISCGYGWFFFGLAGVRAILRYDIENESYDIELPCDQAEETRVISSTQNSRVVCLNAPCSIAVGTRYTARSGIDEISEYDPLYILFYSYLPVSARWENGKYVPG